MVHPALGFTSVASAVEHAGFQVSFYDLNLCGYRFNKLYFNSSNLKYGFPDWQEIEKLIAGVHADFYFVTASFTKNVRESYAVVRLIKKYRPGATVICGGVHATYLPEDLLKNSPEIDYVLRGEAEETAVQLLKSLQEEKEVSSIQGLARRRGESILVNNSFGVISELDSLIIPKREFWPVNEYRKIWNSLFEQKDPLGLIMTSRGCIGKCLFCASGKGNVDNNHLRFRSFNSVQEELNYLIKEYGIKTVDVMDDCLTINKSLLPHFCEFLRSQGLSWICKSRIDMLTEKTIHLLKKSGCERVFIGIESADDNILQQMGKNITTELIRRTLKQMEAAGLDFSASFTIGHPGETESSIRKTELFAWQLARKGKRVGVYLITPYPGSVLYDMAKIKGWIVSGDWQEYDQTANGKPIYAPQGWSPEKLQERYRKSWKFVYKAYLFALLFRPVLLIKKLSGASNPAILLRQLYYGILNAASRITGNSKKTKNYA